MQVASAPTPATIANGGRACLRQGAGLARFPDHMPRRLAEAMRTEWHRFWPDDISLLDAKVANWDAVLESRQVTDTYLLALAVQHGVDL